MTGGSLLVSPAGAVCVQVLVAPLVEEPEFGDALNRMGIRGTTLLGFIADGDGDWLDAVALTRIETVPNNACFGRPSFRGTEMPPDLVSAGFEPPGGLPLPRTEPHAPAAGGPSGAPAALTPCLRRPIPRPTGFEPASDRREVASMRTTRRTLLAGAAGLLAAPPIARAQAPVMRLSHQYPPAHHIARVLAAFAEEVNAKNAGVTVQVYPAEQLARVAENFPGVARGAFEAAVATNFTWGNTIPEMSAPTIPYLFTDLARIRKFPGSDAAQFLDAASARRGVKSVGWLFTTRSTIFTSGRKPIIQLADFQGLKIRGLNPLIDNALRAAGAAPAATPAPEVVGALQSGVLDAGLTDVSAAVSRRFYEVQKFGTVAPFFCVYTQVYVNPRFWDGLPAGARAALEASLRKAETDAVTVTEQTAAAAVGELRAKGMTIHEQTAAEAEAWRAVMQQPVIDAFLRATPEGGQRMLDLLRKLTA